LTALMRRAGSVEVPVMTSVSEGLSYESPRGTVELCDRHLRQRVFLAVADGPVDVRRPIGTAPGTISCPTCGAPSKRVITSPMLGFADPVRMALIDRTESSRDEPKVVSSIPAVP